MDIRTRPMNADDWDSVRSIYAEGVATGNATFETDVPDWGRFDDGHVEGCRLVAIDAASQGPSIVGWAALSPVSRRPVYRGIAEVSVYVAERARGRGVGRALLQALVACSEQAGFWTLQAGILAENEASIRLHERSGFRVLGRRERPAQLHGVWRDTVLMERRSDVVGIADEPGDSSSTG